MRERGHAVFAEVSARCDAATGAQGEDGDYFYMLDIGSADVFVSKDGAEPKLVTEYYTIEPPHHVGAPKQNGT